jgi:hypothetical protein
MHGITLQPFRESTFQEPATPNRFDPLPNGASTVEAVPATPPAQETLIVLHRAFPSR